MGLLQNCWNLFSNFPIVRNHFSNYHKQTSNEHSPIEIPFEHHGLLLWVEFLDVKWLSQSWILYRLLSAPGHFLESLSKWQSQKCEPFSTALFTYQLQGSWLLLVLGGFINTEEAREHTRVWEDMMMKTPLCYCPCLKHTPGQPYWILRGYCALYITAHVSKCSRDNYSHTYTRRNINFCVYFMYECSVCEHTCTNASRQPCRGWRRTAMQALGIGLRAWQQASYPLSHPTYSRHIFFCTVMISMSFSYSTFSLAFLMSLIHRTHIQKKK